MHPLVLTIILMSLCFIIFDFVSVRLWLGLGDMLSFQVVPANSSLLWGKAMIRDSQGHIPGRLDIGLSHLEGKSLISVKGNKFMTSGDLHQRLVRQTQDTPAAGCGMCEVPGNRAATSPPVGIDRDKYGGESGGKGGR